MACGTGKSSRSKCSSTSRMDYSVMSSSVKSASNVATNNK